MDYKITKKELEILYCLYKQGFFKEYQIIIQTIIIKSFFKRIGI